MTVADAIMTTGIAGDGTPTAVHLRGGMAGVGRAARVGVAATETDGDQYQSAGITEMTVETRGGTETETETSIEDETTGTGGTTATSGEKDGSLLRGARQIGRGRGSLRRAASEGKRQDGNPQGRRRNDPH